MPISFANAKVAEAPKKAKKNDKKEIHLSGLDNVAACDAVIKSVTAVKEALMDEVKQEMVAHFVEMGVEIGARPENFRGLGEISEASCELRARSSASALSEEEELLLNRNNIPTVKEVSAVETFIFNPAYMNDPVIMAKIERALSGVKGLPEDLIQKQEERSKTIVSPDAMPVLFATKDETLIEEILPIISVSAIKPKMKEDDLHKSFKIVSKLISGE